MPPRSGSRGPRRPTRVSHSWKDSETPNGASSASPPSHASISASMGDGGAGSNLSRAWTSAGESARSDFFPWREEGWRARSARVFPSTAPKGARPERFFTASVSKVRRRLAEPWAS